MKFLTILFMMLLALTVTGQVNIGPPPSDYHEKLKTESGAQDKIDGKAMKVRAGARLDVSEDLMQAYLVRYDSNGCTTVTKIYDYSGADR